MTSLEQYDNVVMRCSELFINKLKDYGPSWQILRPSSLTDQIYIKAKRIRSMQETGVNRVGESIEGEFVAMINYGLIGLIQLDEDNIVDEMDILSASNYYAYYLDATKALFNKKNHDYGEAWRDMRISSMVDLILMKILRIKQIEDNDGKTTVSEGIAPGYQDIINYSVFCLILMDEEKEREKKSALNGKIPVVVR